VTTVVCGRGPKTPHLIWPPAFERPNGTGCRQFHKTSESQQVVSLMKDHTAFRLAMLEHGYWPLLNMGTLDEMKRDRVIGKMSAQEAFRKHLEQV
jgi:hypothetical protein